MVAATNIDRLNQNRNMSSSTLQRASKNQSKLLPALAPTEESTLNCAAICPAPLPCPDGCGGFFFWPSAISVAPVAPHCRFHSSFSSSASWPTFLFQSGLCPLITERTIPINIVRRPLQVRTNCPKHHHRSQIRLWLLKSAQNKFRRHNIFFLASPRTGISCSSALLVHALNTLVATIIK
jgi:hypothetical protein